MVHNLYRASIFGLMFCLGQSVIEAFFYYLITYTNQTNNINIDGALFYAFVRFILTIGPYFIVFYFALKIDTKVRPAIIAFELNFVAIVSVFLIGLLQKDPIYFLIASFSTSIGFIFIDKIWNFPIL